MNGLNYLLQTNLYLVLFMGFYMVVLRNETFFRQNRIYLNASVLLSFAIPFINSPWFRDLFITQKVRESFIPTAMYETIIIGVNEEASQWTTANIILWVYIGGVVLLLSRFLIQLILLNSNLKLKKGSAFSFFKILVVDHELPQADTIINHETVHIRQWHSVDIVLIELATIINWFNPIVYLYKKELRYIHEFIADEEAASLLQSKSDYAVLLFSNTMGVHPHQLINSFFNKSLLKRRIFMLSKTKSSSTGLWKYGFSAPLFALMLIVSAATVKSEETELIPIAKKLLTPSVSYIDTKPASEISNAGDIAKISKPETPANKSDNVAHQDYTAFKRHILKNIKYPASARQNKISGYIIASFKIQGKKISDLKITKSLHKDLDQEVIKSIRSFQDPIGAQDNNYSIGIVFQLMGKDLKTEVIPNILTTNFIGHIVVTAQESANVPVSKDESIKDFTSVDILPEFEGGMEGWSKYLQNNLKYPAPARSNKITGRVFVSFIINKDGSLTDIKVLRGIGGGLDEEAIRTLKESPKWKPGIKNGEAVRVSYTMPIYFQLNEKP